MLNWAVLDYAFEVLEQTEARLNVFEWNTVAIKCYEKVGFTFNPYKRFERVINGQQPKSTPWLKERISIPKKLRG
jgi:RimJ/RimL family protein N-acetyltransferase